jgi:hypothetical protein
MFNRKLLGLPPTATAVQNLPPILYGTQNGRNISNYFIKFYFLSTPFVFAAQCLQQTQGYDTKTLQFSVNIDNILIVNNNSSLGH